MACYTQRIMEEFHHLWVNSTDVSGLRFWCICLRFPESYTLPSRSRCLIFISCNSCDYIWRNVIRLLLWFVCVCIFVHVQVWFDLSDIFQVSLYQIPVYFHTQYLDIYFYPLQPLYMVLWNVNWSLVFGKICFKKGKKFLIWKRKTHVFCSSYDL